MKYSVAELNSVNALKAKRVALQDSLRELDDLVNIKQEELVKISHAKAEAEKAILNAEVAYNALQKKTEELSQEYSNWLSIWETLSKTQTNIEKVFTDMLSAYEAKFNDFIAQTDIINKEIDTKKEIILNETKQLNQRQRDIDIYIQRLQKQADKIAPGTKINIL